MLCGRKRQQLMIFSSLAVRISCFLLFFCELLLHFFLFPLCIGRLCSILLFAVVVVFNLPCSTSGKHVKLHAAATL